MSERLGDQFCNSVYGKGKKTEDSDVVIQKTNRERGRIGENGLGNFRR